MTWGSLGTRVLTHPHIYFTDLASVQTLSIIFDSVRAPGGGSILYPKSAREANPEKSLNLFPQRHPLSQFRVIIYY